MITFGDCLPVRAPSLGRPSSRHQELSKASAEQRDGLGQSCEFNPAEGLCGECCDAKMRRVAVADYIPKIPALEMPAELNLCVNATTLGIFDMGFVLNHPLQVAVKLVYSVPQCCVCRSRFGLGPCITTVSSDNGLRMCVFPRGIETKSSVFRIQQNVDGVAIFEFGEVEEEPGPKSVSSRMFERAAEQVVQGRAPIEHPPTFVSNVPEHNLLLIYPPKLFDIASPGDMDRDVFSTDAERHASCDNLAARE